MFCYRDRNTVEIAGRRIIKTCTGQDSIQRFEKLKYLLLIKKRVPHTDFILHQYGTTVVLHLRGISKPPATEDEEFCEPVIEFRT